MKAIHVCLILIALTGACLAGGTPKDQQTSAIDPLRVRPFESWEFQKTDGHLWLHFHSSAAKDKEKPQFQFARGIRVQLAGIKTKFVPLVYFKGNEQERKKQKEINDAIATFIAKQLKGKTVWFEETAPNVFAGPGQVMGVVWFDKDRKRSLQRMLIKQGLAVKKSSHRKKL